MQFLNRLKLWQKLALLVVAMAVPTALLGVFYLSGANEQVALAADEIEGARYVQSVGAVLAEAEARGDYDTGRRYYDHWLTALERLVVEKNMTDWHELEHEGETIREDDPRGEAPRT